MRSLKPTVRERRIPLEPSAIGTSPPGPAAEVAVTAVHDSKGRLIASGQNYDQFARVLGDGPDGGPIWLEAVREALVDGQQRTVREHRDAGSGAIIRSEHIFLTDSENSEPLICSRFERIAEPNPRVTRAIAAERLNDVLRLSSEWLFETNANLALTYLSDRVYDDLGLVPAAFNGHRLPEMGVFDGGPECFSSQEDPDRRRPFTDRMADVRHADGTMRRIRFSGVPYFVDGNFAGYRGVAVDETLHATARDAAVRAESRLLVGLAASRDGFAVFDSDGLMVCSNPQMAADLGRSDSLPAGMELGKLLNHALKSGWFVETDAPSLAATKPGLANPENGQSMIEISVADGRRLLFCASHTDCNDVLLISTDISGMAPATRSDRAKTRAQRKSA